MDTRVHQLRPPEDPPHESGGTPSPYDRFQAAAEDMPYRVEIWDEAGEAVAQIVAVSVAPAIGYAAYFAACREYPGRVITLRHRNATLSRWDGRAH